MSVILVIDDEPQILQLFAGTLGDEGHETLLASDGNEGLGLLDSEIDLVIVDMVMPNKEGLETITELRRNKFAMPVIAMSGGGAAAPNGMLHAAKLLGADAVLAKPFTRGEVLTAVRSLLAVEHA